MAKLIYNVRAYLYIMEHIQGLSKLYKGCLSVDQLITGVLKRYMKAEY